MYTEIIISANKELPSKLQETLASVFGQTSDFKASIDKTVFTGNYDFQATIIFAQFSNDKVFLVFQNDNYTLRIHVESVRGKEKFDLFR